MVRQNRNAAIPEAGHGVAAILLRVRTKYASILPDDTSEGRVIYKPGRREPSIGRDMAKMVTAFAGMPAKRAEGGGRTATDGIMTASKLLGWRSIWQAAMTI